jgi:hypothetical protein
MGPKEDKKQKQTEKNVNQGYQLRITSNKRRHNTV